MNLSQIVVTDDFARFAYPQPLRFNSIKAGGNTRMTFVGTAAVDMSTNNVRCFRRDNFPAAHVQGVSKLNPKSAIEVRLGQS